jgi:sec-independent protein translocase protein TatB
MQIFNIGPLELILILVLALIVLGPENMVKTAREMGRTINRFIRSPMWATLMNTTREIRELPTKIVRDTGLEESIKQIQEQTQAVTKELNQELGKSVESLNNAVQQINTEAVINTNQPPATPTAGEATVESTEIEEEPEPENTIKPPEIHPVRTAFEAAGLSEEGLMVLPEDEPIQSVWQAAGLFDEPEVAEDAPMNALAAAGLEPEQPSETSESQDSPAEMAETVQGETSEPVSPAVSGYEALMQSTEPASPGDHGGNGNGHSGEQDVSPAGDSSLEPETTRS